MATPTEAFRAIPTRFYRRPAEETARALLGHLVLSRIRGRVTVGRIVETEAYVGPHDPAAHGYQARRTPRNACLFGAPGIAYVYFSYGMHWLLNAVTDAEGYPAAVLLRALEPVSGVATMRRRRGRRRVEELMSGPGKLTQALGVTGRLDGHPLQVGALQIVHGSPVPPRSVCVTPRIGISKAKDWPLRFVLRGSPFASRPTT